MANIYKNETITEGRVNVFLGWENFNPMGNVAPGRMDQNLCGRLWTRRDQSAISLTVASLDKPLTNATREKLQSYDFKPTMIGNEFGPTFKNHLFRLQIDIADKYFEMVKTEGEDDVELHLMWDSNSEGMVISEDGKPLQGLVGGNHWARRADFKLSTPYKKQYVYYIEISCNGLFGAGRGGDIEPPDMNKFYKLEECCLCTFNRSVWNLIHDVTFLQGCFKKMDKNSPRRVQALQIANDIINVVDVNDKSTYEKGRQLAKQFIDKHNGDGQSVVSTMLHSHIDLAWLWMMACTPAKGARTFASTIDLMKQYPESVFVQSQAQLYEWVKDKYPKLYEEMKVWIAKGRFIPVGGTWVEMDCNIPSGEHLVRQFVYGQNFFKSEFDMLCKVFFLPDTFGYSTQLPQIMNQCQIKYFMTQKLSWNLFNKFPHSSFIWEGLDGSQVLTHMPPSETYNSQGFVEEVLKSANENRDKAVFDNSMLLVGHGDGGNCGSPSMLESLRRMENCSGLPKIQFRTPNQFFEQLETVANQNKLPKWVGELYFELHRGTFTTQAEVKRDNRLSELYLCQVEMISLLSELLDSNFKYPVDQLKDCWKRILKNGFHDTLPGSCIGLVYKETAIDYNHVKSFCVKTREDAMYALANSTHISDVQNGKKKRKSVNGNAVDVTSNGSGSHAAAASRPPIIALSTGPIGKTKDIGNEVRVIEIDESSIKDMSNIHAQPSQSVYKTSNDEYNKMEIDHITSHDFTNNKVLVAAKGLRSAYGINRIESFVSKDDESLSPVRIHENEHNQYIMTNDLVTMTIESSGLVTSLKLHKSKNDRNGKELISKPSNQFVIYDDHPMFWEAWDVEVYSFEKYKLVEGATSIQIMEQGPLQSSIKITYPTLTASSSKSSIEQTIIMKAGSKRVDFKTHVNWQERRQCLRVLFDVNIRSDMTSYDTQFGYVKRTNRFNTSWDVAKFECVGHRYINLSEYDFGLSLMTDSKYGYSVKDNLMRISLLRSPKSPDDHADIGTHDFVYSIMPHFDQFPNNETIREAHDLNEKITVTTLPGSNGDFDGWGVRVHEDSEMHHLGVSCLKKIEDSSVEDVYVMRVYEEMGGRGNATLEIVGGSVTVVDAKACNMLENAAERNDVTMSEDGRLLSMPFTPFQIRSILLKLKSAK